MLSTTFRDNDRIYGQGVAGFLKRCQIEEVRTAYGCPWQNPFVERFGDSLRREVLDHLIVLNQAHLERVLREYIEEFYHTDRPHQGLEGQVRLNRLPCWLDWDEKKDEPVVNGAKAKVVQRMFALACLGNGILAICRKMADTPPISTSKKNSHGTGLWLSVGFCFSL